MKVIPITFQELRRHEHQAVGVNRDHLEVSLLIYLQVLPGSTQGQCSSLSAHLLTMKLEVQRSQV